VIPCNLTSNFALRSCMHVTNLAGCVDQRRVEVAGLSIHAHHHHQLVSCVCVSSVALAIAHGRSVSAHKGYALQSRSCEGINIAHAVH
jgi:hypothetical protein